ncbi:hypothetical protein C5C43_12735, partial [Rathayibacter rathayi]
RTGASFSGAVGAGVGAAFAKVGSGIVVRTAEGAAGGASQGAIEGAGGYMTGPGPHTVDGLVMATAENALIGGATGGITAKMPPWLSLNDMECFDKWIYRSRYTTEPTVVRLMQNSLARPTNRPMTRVFVKPYPNFA